MRHGLIKHKIALVVLAGFIAFLGVCMPPYFREISSAKWSTTSGMITRSQLRAAYISRGHFNGYIPDVEYRYTVGGSHFTGTQITFHLHQTIHAQEVAEGWLAQYPTGKVVTVYYDPQAPAVSVLRPGIQSEQRWIFYAGIFYIVASAVAFFLVLYDYRRRGSLAARFSDYIHKV
jgi:hypothetical protein